MSAKQMTVYRLPRATMSSARFLGLGFQGWLRLGVLAGLFSPGGSLFAQNDLGVTTDAASVRGAVIGDFGSRSNAPAGRGDECLAEDPCDCHWHQQVATYVLEARHKANPFDIGLTVGDNFYPRGVRSAQDKHWECSWKRFYGRLDLIFYPSLGNHDYGTCFRKGSPDAQIHYSDLDDTWTMPARYYTFRAGPVRFFAIDTENFKKDQIKWLRESLDKYSDARWKIVYGHRPMYSCSHHGDTSKLINRLLPVVAPEGHSPRIDAYLSGHDHDLQAIEMNGITYLVSGGGGRENSSRRPPQPSACSTRVRNANGLKYWSDRGTYGHLEFEADDSSLLFRFIDQEGEEVWKSR